MAISYLLARILGVIFTVLYGSVLYNRQYYRKLVATFKLQPAGLLLSGFIGLITGLLIVEFHNVWVLSWPLIITLFGWLLILSGTARILFPEALLKFTEKLYDRHELALTRVTIVMFLLGLYLSYIGFTSK